MPRELLLVKSSQVILFANLHALDTFLQFSKNSSDKTFTRAFDKYKKFVKGSKKK